MQLTGKFNVFNRTKTIKKDGKEFTFKEFNTTLSHKDKDGNWENAYIELEFANKEKFPREVQNKFKDNYYYVIEVTDGWLDFRKYTKDGKEYTIYFLVVHECECKDAKRVEKAKEAKVQAVNEQDLPF